MTILRGGKYMYCVRMASDEVDMVVGYATTEDKAKKMIAIMKETDGFEGCYNYEYYKVFIDTLIINGEKIVIE
jgi:hypothetical protein